jgi:hypothetical protein
MTTIPTFTELLKGARLPEADHPICLRADLTAEFEAAERELERLRKQAPVADSLAGSPTRSLALKIEELQRQMQEATYHFRLRALPKSKWRALVADHPPRKDDKGEPIAEDAQVGINKEAFLDALIRVSVIDPVMTAREWRVFLEGHSEEEKKELREAGREEDIRGDGVLTDRQYSDLCDEAWFLNRGEVSVPFSRAASLLRRDTASE